jgi:hypothetical protein
LELPNENECRLIPPLRAAAKTKDPLKILARAASRSARFTQRVAYFQHR